MFFILMAKKFIKEGVSLKFAYRQSYFSDNNFVILKAIFNLKNSEKCAVENKCIEYYSKRKSLQPYSLPSAGSIFKRPEEGGFAPIYIEKCGLKGKVVGGAEISKKHCGFIVNPQSNAKFNDVFKLINKIKKTVSKKFDIMLKEEIIILK